MYIYLLKWNLSKRLFVVIFVYLSQMKKLSPRGVSDLSEDLGTELKFRASE